MLCYRDFCLKKQDGKEPLTADLFILMQNMPGKVLFLKDIDEVYDNQLFKVSEDEFVDALLNHGSNLPLEGQIYY